MVHNHCSLPCALCGCIPTGLCLQSLHATHVRVVGVLMALTDAHIDASAWAPALRTAARLAHVLRLLVCGAAPNGSATPTVGAIAPLPTHALSGTALLPAYGVELARWRSILRFALYMGDGGECGYSMVNTLWMCTSTAQITCLVCCARTFTWCCRVVCMSTTCFIFLRCYTRWFVRCNSVYAHCTNPRTGLPNCSIIWVSLPPLRRRSARQSPCYPERTGQTMHWCVVMRRAQHKMCLVLSVPTASCDGYNNATRVVMSISCL